MSRAGIAVILAVLLASCAPTYADGYVEAFSAGLRAQNAGRHEEAARHFDEAARLGVRYKDRDEARLLEAEAFERLERWDEAEATYRRVERESGGRYHGVRAAFALGRLVWDRRGFDEGAKELLTAVRKYPSSGLVRHAIRRLLSQFESDHGPQAALAWLEPILRGMAKTEAEEAIHYEYARLLARCDRNEDAVRELLEQARAHPYPSGSLTDDAYYVASVLLADLGRPREAVAVLEEMMAPREAAYAGASYVRPRWPQAAYRIAMLHRDALADRAGAKREFLRTYETHTTSMLADDALFQLAKLEHEDRREREACAAISRLVEEKAQSRYVHCAHLLCSTAAPTERPCQPYIEAILAGEKGEREENPDR